MSESSLYVYYRVPGRDAGLARAAAYRAAALIQTAGVTRPRLMRRPEPDREGRQTWMEIYEPWNEAWQAEVDRAVVASGLAALIEGERHPELFEALEPRE